MLIVCGIVGSIDLAGGTGRREWVEPLLPSLAHRGPDDQRVETSGPVAFGHTRLSIVGVDKPHARQPFSIERNLLNFNGEIYNFQDVLRRLKADRIPMRGGSDTEAIGACLHHWGVEHTLASIDGMFAFAWYNSDERSLTLSRDPLGEKPLYWTRKGNRLWFASEIKALLLTGEISDEPNLARIDDYLYTAKVNGPETIFAAVNEVEPGTYVTFRCNDTEYRTQAYWRAEDAFGDQGNAPSNGAVDVVAQQLADAIESRRVSDVPIGVLLSGGIDSCAIAEHFSANPQPDTLHLFFADNENIEYSERSDVEEFLGYIRDVRPDWDYEFHPEKIGFDNYFRHLQRITWFYDEPVQFYNSPLLSNLCGKAKGLELKVLVSGEGSDEIFYGYDRFLRTHELMGRRSSDVEHLRHLYFGGGLQSVDAVRGLTDAVADGAEATAPWRWLEQHLDKDFNLLQQIYSQRFRMQMLLQRQDRVGMADSIEIRVPFLRPKLVDWSNRLRLDDKVDFASGQTKLCLRAAMENRLPKRILTKGKDGFPSDMTSWLKTSVMYEVATKLVGDSGGFCQNYLDGKAANALIDDHFAGRRPLATLVLNLVSLEIWHRICRPSVAKQSVLEI